MKVVQLPGTERVEEDAPMDEWAEPIRDPITIRVDLPEPRPILSPIMQVISGAACGLLVAIAVTS